jgi:hypothetical protein
VSVVYVLLQSAYVNIEYIYKLDTEIFLWFKISLILDQAISECYEPISVWVMCLLLVFLVSSDFLHINSSVSEF